MTTDPKFKKLKSKGFILKTKGDSKYYYFEHNNVVFKTSNIDEPFKVYFNDSKMYWTDLDDIFNMINFFMNTEID